MFNTIDEAIEWVTKRRHENKGLPNFCDAMRVCGNPQDSFKTIHVGGTNGKGSTVSYIKDILMEASYHVGTFTSPHLVKHQDRIRYQNEWISDEIFLKILNQYESLILEYKLNMFEIDMLVASIYFKEMKVDFAIIEVGLGGRLDSTNCLTKPELSIITSIGLDHVELLGDTVEKIAIEKAGILKDNVPCLLGELKDTCENEIQKIADLRNSMIYHTLKYEKVDRYHFKVNENIYLNRSGALYQMKNATLAISAIDLLKGKNIVKLSQEDIIHGIDKSNWEGRFETISDHPRIILDGAHNDEGIHELVESLKDFPKPLIIVFSALKDKPTKDMIEQLHNIASTLLVTEFNFYRVEKARNLVHFNDIICMPSYEQAIHLGLEECGSNGTLVMCGSLYFISEVRAYLLKGKMGIVDEQS